MRAAALLPLLAHAAASAHPHVDTDQQAHVVIGRDDIVVTWLIAPTRRSGGHLFDHIDLDRDGVLNAPEKQAFGAALIARSRLMVDAAEAPLTLTRVAIADRGALARGGLITVSARAPLPPRRAAGRRVTFDVSYSRFGKRWFVQPFVRQAHVRPIVTRSARSNAVVIAI